MKTLRSRNRNAAARALREHLRTKRQRVKSILA
jgi:hypothetical protein